MSAPPTAPARERAAARPLELVVEVARETDVFRAHAAAAEACRSLGLTAEAGILIVLSAHEASLALLRELGPGGRITLRASSQGGRSCVELEAAPPVDSLSRLGAEELGGRLETLHQAIAPAMDECRIAAGPTLAGRKWVPPFS